jgi:Cellulose binding domain
VANHPGRPAQGPGRLAGSLARHRWITAAGMTATVAAVAAGGVALAFHDSSAAPRQECGLVPCAAALPASVQSGGNGPASATGSPGPPTTAAPTVPQRASAPPSAPATAPEAAAPPPARPSASSGLVSPSATISARAPVSAGAASPPLAISFPAPAASSAGRAVSADRAMGVGYAITEDGEHGIHGQIVIVNNGSAPVTRWRVRVVLPGDTHYQVLSAENRSAGDALVMASAAGQALAGGSIAVVAFTASGSTSTPVRCTFTDAGRARHRGRGGSGAAAGQEASAGGSRTQSGRRGHDGWPGGGLGGWLNGSWSSQGWPGRDEPGHGWAGGGRDGQRHGWPGGR